MADLTSKDRENYQKLKNAFLTLNSKTYNTPLEQVTESVNKNLVDISSLNDTGDLRKQVNLVNSYLNIFALLAPTQLADVQEIASINDQLDSSLKVVESEVLNLTDEVEDFNANSILLELLSNLQYEDDVKKLTKALLCDRQIDLTELEINKLIRAWGKAIQHFVEDARKDSGNSDKLMPGEPKTLGHFFAIHNDLEALYSRIADTEVVQEAV